MKPQPIYKAHNLNPAYSLRYTWTGWPSAGLLPALPKPEVFDSIKDLWEADGLRLLEPTWTDEEVKLTFSTKPIVSPVLLAQRAKGRLKHALSTNDISVDFSRKVAVRSVGENHTHEVENYIRNQVGNSEYADERYRELLKEFTVDDETVDLSLPTESRSGRYWYNLHTVLVTQARHPIRNSEQLALIRDRCFKIAERRGYQISVVSVLPDHVHMALRPQIEESPEEVALSFQNNLAYALGQNAVWSCNYYVGTFGEYDMNAIRMWVKKRMAPRGVTGEIDEKDNESHEI